MDWNYQEYKEKRKKQKKEDPIAFKFQFACNILSKITNAICCRMNNIGWSYKEGSDYEKMDYFYHWKIENFNHRKSYDFNLIKDTYNINNRDTRDYVVKYLEEAYKLFIEGSKLTYCYSSGQINLYDSWFKKNINKFKKNRW